MLGMRRREAAANLPRRPALVAALAGVFRFSGHFSFAQAVLLDDLAQEALAWGGARGSLMAERVAVFIDAHNVYMGARRAFHRPAAWKVDGQVWPGQLGELICERGGPGGERTLEYVRIFRGVASEAEDAVGHAAARRQIAAWERHPKVRVFEHTLKRRSTECPNCGEVGEQLVEKGVDVHLASDLIDGAYQGAFDVGVVFSTDTDFVPAIRLAANLGVEMEVAAWWTGVPHRDRPLLDGEVRCQRLWRADYKKVRDRRSYRSW